VLPLSVLTAWEGLVDRAMVSAGKTVWIHVGAGGVGHVAVQVALALGAEGRGSSCLFWPIANGGRDDRALVVMQLEDPGART